MVDTSNNAPTLAPGATAGSASGATGMTAGDSRLTIGVEEEFHVVDLSTRELVPRAGEVLDRLPAASFTVACESPAASVSIISLSTCLLMFVCPFVRLTPPLSDEGVHRRRSSELWPIQGRVKKPIRGGSAAMRRNPRVSDGR